MASGVGAFTDEQERRFCIRHEEGFNVFTDKEYGRWLKIHYPESLPHSTVHDVTLTEHFSSVVPAVEISITHSLTVSPGAENSPSTSCLASTVSQTIENSPSTSRLASTVSPTTENSPSIIRLPSTVSLITENSPSTSHLPSSVSEYREFSLHKPSGEQSASDYREFSLHKPSAEKGVSEYREFSLHNLSGKQCLQLQRILPPIIHLASTVSPTQRILPPQAICRAQCLRLQKGWVLQ